MPSEHKRKRTASPSAHPTPKITSSITKSTDVYWDDGNIAVVASNVAFRVHRSQLAFHSEVFKDMLALVTEPQDGEVFDGCPVVRLSDDSQDLATLFKVMYGQIQFNPEMVDQLISTIRLSTKYLMDPIRTAAVGVLAIAYPQTLKQWDAYEGSRGRCGDVLKLATEVNADILLPAAYYAMSTHTTSSILERDLQPPLLQNLLPVRDQLMTLLANFVSSKVAYRKLIQEHCFGDKCSDICDEMQAKETSLVLNTYSFIFSGAADPLTGFKSLMEIVGGPLCQSCKDTIEGNIEHTRATIWREPPRRSV